MIFCKISIWYFFGFHQQWPCIALYVSSNVGRTTSCYNFHIYDLHCHHEQLKHDFPKLFLLKIICYTNSIHIYYLCSSPSCAFVNQFHEKMIFHMPGNDAAIDDFDCAFSNPLTKEIFCHRLNNGSDLCCTKMPQWSKTLVKCIT